MPSKGSSSNGTALNTPSGFLAHSKRGVPPPKGHDCVPDHFLDLIADAINEDESLLDAAVDRLAAANKRVHDAIDAIDDRKLYSDEQPKRVLKGPGGKYDLDQTRGNASQSSE
jgi:hypothetical protein